MKKVLFLIHTLGAGGAEKVLVNLVNHMSERYDVTLMTVIDTGIFREQLNENITYKTMFKIPFQKKKHDKQSGSLLNKTSKVKSFMASSYAFLWRHMPTKLLYKWKIKETYDIEVSFLEGICAKIISASNQNSKKYAWIHVDLINERKSERVFRNRIVEKKCYQKFDKIVAVSEKVRQQFIRKFDFDEKKVVVKYNAINVEEILKKSDEKKDIPFVDGFKIITVGRLSYQKGYDRLLEIADRLKKDQLKFCIWIIGVGPKEEELKQYIEEHQLDDHVKLLGFQENPYCYMKEADLFVCSSRAEGFSTVVCEATVIGVPIVTTDCSGMYELLGDNQFGIITENSTEALYQGLKTMIEDKAIYQHYKNQINKRKDFFDIKNSVQQVEEMFGEDNEK